MLVEITLVQLAAVASPGPNALLVSHSAVAQSRRAGLWTATGVATGAVVWAASVALGLGLLLDLAPGAAGVLRVLGGLYLVVLGVRTFRHAAPAPHERAADAAPNRARTRARHAWARGALTNLANPKAAVYYVSVFGAVLPADAADGSRAAAVGLVALVTLAYYGALALALSTARARTAYLGAARGIDRVAGTAMVAFGVLFVAAAL